MKLTDNWLTEGIIDFEYKKYLLLAYLKNVEKEFTHNKLYPVLADLIMHYQNLNNFMQKKIAANNAFPKELDKIDLQNFILTYERAVHDDEMMQEIERILNFSIPAVKKSLDEGREIYEWIEEQLKLFPLGIMPLQQGAGYLFIRNGGEKDTKIYEYNLSLLHHANDTYRSLQTRYVSTYSTGIINTYEKIKSKIIQRQKLLIAPAVYVLESEVRLPLAETLLPIAKRVLVRHLTSGGY